MIINSNLQVVNKEKAYLFGELIDYTESTVNYLKNTAKNYLITRCLELSQALKLPINSVKTKNFKSRWGSCDINNNITLNYRLIMLPKDAIDYVIIHELCHTLEFNHQKGFHKLLKDLSVNEKAHKNTLKYFNFLLKIEY